MTCKARVKALLFQLLALLLLSTALQAQGISPEAMSKARLVRKHGLSYLYLEGAPYEMGYQHGALMKEQILKIYDIYLQKKAIKDWVKNYALLKSEARGVKDPAGYLLEKARIMEKYIPPDIIEEMKGLADGAGVTYEEVLMMSTHVDYFGMLTCTGFAASGPASADGKLYSGRNLDWGKGFGAELDEMVVIMTQKPTDGIPFVSMTYPGLIGILTAMNEKKLTLELNFAMTKDTKLEGVPVMILLLDVIRNIGSLDEAVKKIAEAPHTSGFNILITDGDDNKSEVVEFSGSTVGFVPMTDGAVYTANHFVSKELAGTNIASRLGAGEVNTETRYARMGELLAQNHGRIDMEMSKTMMHDAGIKVESTLHTIIFEPGSLKFLFWRRGMEPGGFIDLSLPMLMDPGFYK